MNKLFDVGLLQWQIQGGGGGSGGWNPPFFWPINAFEWEHIVGTPPLLFLKWLDPPLCCLFYLGNYELSFSINIGTNLLLFNVVVACLYTYIE